MKQLYELLTYPLTVIDDPILDFIFITVLGSISFIIAWNFVGETGIRGKAGSVLHWTIRIIVMFVLSTITSILIKCALFLYNMPKEKWIMVGILFLVLIIMGIIMKFTLFSKKEKSNRHFIRRRCSPFAYCPVLPPLCRGALYRERPRRMSFCCIF